MRPTVQRCRQFEAAMMRMDVVGDFITECCMLGPRCTVPKAALYGAYETWCEKAREKPGSKRVFTDRLTGRGVGEERIGHERTRIANICEHVFPNFTCEGGSCKSYGKRVRICSQRRLLYLRRRSLRLRRRRQGLLRAASSRGWQWLSGAGSATSER